MKTTAKIISLVLALMMVVSVMASCGDDESSSKKKSSASTSAEGTPASGDEIGTVSGSSSSSFSSESSTASGKYSSIEAFFNSGDAAAQEILDSIENDDSSSLRVEGNTMYMTLTDSKGTYTDEQLKSIGEMILNNTEESASTSEVWNYVDITSYELSLKVVNSTGVYVYSQSVTVDKP